MAALNPVVQSYLAHKLSERQAHYTAVQQYRAYADGDQTVHLTDDQKILLVGDDGSGNPASDPEFVLNICSTILDVETDRLNVQSISVRMPDNEVLSDDLTSLVSEWWKASRMDEGQQNGHFAACRDADSFPFVYYDDERVLPRIAINAAYDGADNGADMFYIDDDPNQPDCAMKIWTVENTPAKKVKRKNIYYDDRIEYWINDGALTGATADAGWRPLNFADADWSPTMQTAPVKKDTTLSSTATVEWWTDTGTPDGRPMGIPVFHLRHQARGTAYGRSTIADVVPGLQDAINRAGIDVMAGALLSGFKMVTVTGLDPNISTLKAYPGAIFAIENEAASVGQIAESDLLQLIEVKNTFIKDAATLTNTPLSFFNLGGQAPAEGSQKALEMGLLAKTRRNQTSFGNTWEDVVRFMLKLDAHAVGGQVTLTDEQIDALEISVEWEPAGMRDEQQDIATAEAWQRLGVPQKFIWRKLGFDEDEIAEMEEEADLRRQQAMGQLTQTLKEMDANNGANAPANRAIVGNGGGPGANGAGGGGA